MAQVSTDIKGVTLCTAGIQGAQKLPAKLGEPDRDFQQGERKTLSRTLWNRFSSKTEPSGTQLTVAQPQLHTRAA